MEQIFINSKYNIRNSSSLKGFTLVEVMVVLSAFSLLAVLVTYILLYSLRGTTKSEQTYNIRNQLDYTTEIIARQLRNAKDVNCTGTGVNYTDDLGGNAFFSCDTNTDVEKVASGSGTIDSPDDTYEISSSDVDLTLCTFTCTTPSSPEIFKEVLFKISGKSKVVQGAEASESTVETRIQLRNR